jgi:putative methionine-R-sulfoxide reductase with GAF domain
MDRNALQDQTLDPVADVTRKANVQKGCHPDSWSECVVVAFIEKSVCGKRSRFGRWRGVATN